ncbi:MAG: hypothetical protein KBT87_04435 [Gammaproteobacteria bacterium]|jgi:hypothetical protein|nr:hypothetical protein [Gammaproteobacteria bacterium]MBQ0773902.1 hypothetical protein [Gammaproteobacteria bacterium]|tara:strand:- start:28676 stop:29488 length:813 start_codon:yes stop_codon:yes gene_type:complete
MFKKLALVTAIAALPVSGFAMEALEDSALSDVTGQDGISLSIDINSTLTLGIEDTDGFTGNLNSGMIIIDGMSMVGTAAIEIDSASTATGGGVIQIGVTIPTLTIQTGDIGVGLGTDGTSATAGIANLVTEAAAVAPIIDSVGVTLTGVSLTLQVGNEATNLVSLATSAPVDIQIGNILDANDNFTLNDLSANGGGSLIVNELAVNNVDLNGITIDVTTGGLVINTNGALVGMDIAAMGVKMGTAASASIGNVYVTGLDLSNQTITVTGH